MPAMICKHCGKQFDAVAEMTDCPHCQQDVAAEVLATMRPDVATPEMSQSMLNEDTAQTTDGRTIQVSDEELEQLIGESSRTLDSAGKSPNFGDFTSTLKPTDSVLESVDLSSAIPPRGIAMDDKPGEAKDYRLGKKIGSGAFGVVYQAEQIALQRSVALKMLKPRKQSDEGQSDDTRARIKSQRVKDRNEFLREAQFTGKLEHPNIVPVHDIGLVTTKTGTGNRPFYVMKEIKGQSWQSKIKQKTRNENVEILRRVAEAIGYAHDKNILHCDLKPENVMLGEFGEVLVVDWGQAVDTSRPETFRPGGSPAYISPEMAKYWCDVYLDGQESSLAIKDVGTQSDVYLLGAMLFEIVAGKPPHFGLKGETAHDVMRRAIDNQISKHEKWMDDELMTIARQALRLDPSVTYQTVADFQEALRQYETRRVSIDLRDRAMDLLDDAKANDDYDAYGKARFGFEESIEKWDGNDLSKTGLSDARLSCAELALKDQNFDLGIGMLEDPETEQEVSLRKKLVAEKSRRDRRKKVVGFLSLGLVAAGILGGVLLAFAIQQRVEAGKATELARLKTQKADAAEKKAENATAAAATANAEAAEAEALKKEAQALTKTAEQKEKTARESLGTLQKDLATKQKEFENQEKEFKIEIATQQGRLDTQKGLADKAREDAIEARKASLLAEREAADAKARNKLLKYRDGIVQIESAVADGDYSTATQRMESNEDAKPFVEWARLKMLTHPESAEFLKQGSPIEIATASRDGKWLAMVTGDAGDNVVVRESENFDNIIGEYKVPGVSAVAISPDGNTLAAGVPGEIGKVVIFQGGVKTVINEAPSRGISDLQFSADGNRLVCVGKVSPLRKSVGLEEELMVYQREAGSWLSAVVADGVGGRLAGDQPSANRVPVMLTLGKKSSNLGAQPIFSNAIFSNDGNRILLTTNTGGKTGAGTSRGKSIYLYEYDGKEYRWNATAESSGVDVAIFANDSGTEVVGCETDDTGSNLFVWSPEAEMGEDEQFISTNLPRSLENRLEKIQRLENRVRSMRRISRGSEGDYILAAGDDKKVSLWNWSERVLVGSYSGHSGAIDFCTLIQNGVNVEASKLISITYGDKPEVLKTDLAKFVADRETLVLGDTRSKTLSPTSLYLTGDQEFAVTGHDNGHVTLKRLAMTRDESGAPAQGESIEWDVSAWKRHVLSNEHLYAQSSNDEFLRFDRKTGALTGVLQQLARRNAGEEIEKFQVSKDGKVALVETDSARREFQIWDLSTQVLVKEIDYSALTTNKLPFVKLSADGQYVVAGKIGFAVWSTQPGQAEPILNKFGGNRAASWPRSPINNVVFYPNDNGECEFAISWPELKGDSRQRAIENQKTGRIHVYTKREQTIQLVGRFRVSIADGAFNPGIRSTDPNLFDARMIGGSRYVLVRSSKSIDMLRLRPGDADPDFDRNEWDASDKVGSFANAKYVRFSDQSDDVLVLNKTNDGAAAVQRWNAATGQTDDLNLVASLEASFPEFPRGNIDTIHEDADGVLTIQTLVRSTANKARKVYNTLSLNQDFSISALRVLANPPVKYAAIANGKVLTLDCGTIRKWSLVPNGNPRQQPSQFVKPDGVLQGFYQDCQVSPDGQKLLVTERVTGHVLVLDAETGQSIYGVEPQLSESTKPSTVAWSENGAQVAIGFDNGEIQVFDIANGTARVSKSPIGVIDAAVKTLTFKNSGNSLLAVMDGNTNYAIVYQKKALEKVEAIDDVIEEQAGFEDEKAVAEWFAVVIGYPGGNSNVVSGHLSEDGRRVVTGSDTGQLTLWNSELFEAVAVAPNFESDQLKEQVEQRELLQVEKYASPVRFVQFFQNPNNSGLIDIIAADKGGINETVNEMEIWKTLR